MSQFLEACGACSSLRIAVEAPGGGAPEVHSFELPFAIVGRTAGADLRFDHPEVSERHAYLQLIDGRLVFLDLGSRIGIQQAGKRRRLGLLRRDPATRIGPYRLRWINDDLQTPEDRGSFDLEPDDLDTAAFAQRFLAKPWETSSDASSGESLILDLSHRSTRRSRVENRGAITLVGSGAECQVRLIDPSVSSLHCSIVQTQEGTWLVDLLGKGGIKVNGRAMNHARLFQGDEAQIGASAFKVEALPSLAREAGRLGFARSARRQHVVVEEPAETESPEPIAVAVAVAEMPRQPIESESSTIGPDDEAGPATLLALSELRETPSPASKLPDLAVEPPSELGLSVAQTAEIVERVVSPLLDQLTEIRRQMLEEFHQARVMMFETIGSLQQEQSAIFNAEIDHLRQLAKDLEIHRKEIGEQAERLSEKAGELERYPLRIAAEPVPKSLPFTITEAEPERALIPAAHVVNVNPESSYRSTSRPNDEQIHAALCDRITRLKADHQTRWQKLLGIFPAGAVGKS